MAIPFRDDAPTRAVPWVTIALIVTNVLVFLFLQPAVFQTKGSDSTDLTPTEARQVRSFEQRWAVVPCEVHHLKPLSSGIHCDPVRSRPVDTPDKVVLLSILTAMFIHASFFHLLGNMLFLWVFGAAVEDRLTPVPYLLLYLLTGVVATMGQALMHWGSPSPVLGASGAIAGLLGAYLVFRPRGRILSVVLWTVVYVPAWMLLGVFFVQQFFTPDSAGIAWEAHASGMVAGFIAALLLARAFPDPWRPVIRPSAPDRGLSAVWSLPGGPPAG